MAIVTGTIEPLKRLKEELSNNGITRFNSIAEISSFTKSYESELRAIPGQVKNNLDNEIFLLQEKKAAENTEYETLKKALRDNIRDQIKAIAEKIDKTVEKSNKNLFNKINYWLELKLLDMKKRRVENGIEKTVDFKSRKLERGLSATHKELTYLSENKEAIASDRITDSKKRLEYTKQIIDDLYPVIAGAIGETAVVTELKKLPDSYYVINDFSLKLNPPIYNKKEKDRIYSIQVDHILVSQSGIFVLETKNWSKKSINDFDLRSPIEQISRTSYALFVLLNSTSKKSGFSLKNHHWGKKKIPIRNIAVMTNARPKEEFKHVKVMSLDKLNGYVSYFGQVFDEEEVAQLFNYLCDMQD